MRVLEKTVTLGEKKFKVVTDRDIAVKAFEEFPDLIEFLTKKEKEKNFTEESFFLEAIKNKELGTIFHMEDRIAELVAFALPIMLKKAECNEDANEIIAYAVDNGVGTDFYNGILGFLMQGFTQRELAKPKIKFSMK